MKKLSQRVTSLTSSITIGLGLFAVALTALLAYRAFDASRAQREMSEQTLREYAGFAAFQLKYATVARISGQQRMAFEHVVRWINTRGPTPALPPERLAELIADKGEQCRCLEDVGVYFQVTFADSGIQTTASALATPATLSRIRDTVIAQALAPDRPDPQFPSAAGTRPLGVPLTSQFLVAIIARLGERPYMLTHVLTVDTIGQPLVAYGFAAPAEVVLRSAVTSVLASQPVLPSTLTRSLRVDSILAVTVRTPAGELVYESDTPVAALYAATDSLEERLGGLHFEVAIDPAAAGQLIIGGLPRSRVPEVLATALVAVCLLVLLLYQFRRQEELGRLREDFVSGVSHELRTPLTQIRLLAELLRLGKVPTDDQKERALRIIDTESRRLSFLVDSILTFTHARRGHLSPVSTDIAGEIEEIVSGFEPLAKAHGVQLMTRLRNGVVAGVDRGALRQVLINLLDNAVRYGPPGQKVTISTTSDGEHWTLEVTDEGPGIPAHERERIFDPYYRMERDAGGAVGGTGIGLAVVRRLVEEHGGRIHVAPVHADTSIGARFVIALPVNAPVPAP